MWFKQLSFYLLNADNIPTCEELNQKLAEAEFAPCQGLDWFSEGFNAPLSQQPDVLAFEADNTYRVTLKKEDKVLPSTVIRDILDEKIQQIQEAEARTVGRKEKQELKDIVTDDLLPRAFTRSSKVEAILDRKHQFLFINQSNSNKAENILSKLRQALGGLEARLPNTKQSPSVLMTEWLGQKHGLGGFELGSDCELKGAGDAAPVVRVSNQDLTADEVTQHLDTGKVVTQMGLNWRDQICFVLTQDFTIKRIQYLDVIQEEAANHGDDAASLLMASQILMCEALGTMLTELISHLGGVENTGNNQ